MITNKKFWFAFVITAIVMTICLSMSGNDSELGKCMIVCFGISGMACCGFLGHLIYSIWKEDRKD